MCVCKAALLHFGRFILSAEAECDNATYLIVAVSGHGWSAVNALLLVHVFGNCRADAAVGKAHCVPHLSTP